MVDWNQIETVLLDMDGTILDLHFDNYFWQEYLPVHWGRIRGLDPEIAKQQLIPMMKSIEGTLSWYCLDFWSRELEIEIIQLKADIEHLIQVRPSALEFLEALNTSGWKPVMVTNAHEDLINMKLKKTGIGCYFSHIVSSHRLGSPKEEKAFWESLQKSIEFDPEKTLLVDDNLTVLRTARSFGILHLLGIAYPDSRGPERNTEEFTAIYDFNDVLSPPLMQNTKS